jgi:hypothetical protein
MTSLTQPMKGVWAPDKATVVFEFNRPIPSFVDVLDYWYADQHLRHRPIAGDPQPYAVAVLPSVVNADGSRFPSSRTTTRSRRQQCRLRCVD